MRRSIELGTLSRSRASLTAFKIIDLLQDEPLEYAVAALGLTLQAVCDTKRLSPSEIMTAADNMIRATGLEDDNYVEALRRFIGDEIQ